MDSNSNTVVVTGFGPFRQYLVNSSWEAVKELSKMGLGSDIDLQIVQLPVSYQKTKELVWKIWTTLQPLGKITMGQKQEKIAGPKTTQAKCTTNIFF
ncbi:pyroglutamyl-peptidase 1-like protein isoform B [Alligator mississippiensis]|uniref:Pyroglutamyl-peptidase 1-like protein isoform B n=1 Tax=Alligator mississippiensis TaxID=8496 RepID=A0A151M945_ALLMI|nr:pyroglutamyl-peptidase 1-like protein isoform B [Alligator mississippiensis]